MSKRASLAKIWLALQFELLQIFDCEQETSVCVLIVLNFFQPADQPTTHSLLNLSCTAAERAKAENNIMSVCISLLFMCGLNEVNVASKVDVHLIYSLFSEFKSIVKKKLPSK